MRIERLDLVAFGHFTDHSLELGPPAADGTDLHVVHGPNEAGKSTTLAAIGELLYGMPHRSRWAFRHDNAVLEIGARLTDDGTALEVRRHKNRLVDETGHALEEKAIDTHGLGLDEYRARFSLDERSLEQGSDAILEQQGELGAALFSAAAGLADLGSRLERAMAPADAFYQPRKRTQIALLELKGRLAEIDAELAERDVDTRAWTALRSATDAARERHASQEALVAELQSGVTALERRSRASSAAERRARVRARLDGLDALPELPDDVLDAFAAEHAAHDKARGAFETAGERVAELEGELAALAIDEPVLAHRDAIEALGKERVIVAERRREAPAARDALERAEHACASLARRLELGDDVSPLDVSVPEDVVVRLEALALERAALITARDAAATELDALDEEPTEPTEAGKPGERAPDGEAELPDATLLVRFVEQLVGEAPWAARDALRARRDELATVVGRALESLAPWHGDAGALARLVPPEPTSLAALETRATALSERTRTLEDDARRHAEELAANADARDALADAGIVDDARLAALREARDTHVVALREAIGRSVPTAELLGPLDALETALAALDAAADARVAHGDAVAELRALDTRRKALERRGERLRAATDEHATAARGFEADVASVATALGLTGASLTTVLAWLPRRATALQRIDELHDIDAKLDRARTDLEARAERLAVLLAPFVPATPRATLAAAPLDELLPLARETLGAHGKRREREERAARERRERDAQRERRRRALEASEACLGRWQASWERAVGERPALAGDAATTIGRLPSWRELGREAQALGERRAALAAIDGALERFERRARDTLGSLAASDPVSPPDETPDAPSTPTRSTDVDDATARVATLEVRLAKAVRAAEEAARTSRQIEARRTGRDEARETLEPLARRLEALRERVGADDLAALPAVVDRVRERRTLRERLAELEEDLRDALATDDIDAALAACETLDRDATETDLAARRERLEAERRELAECFATLKHGERELVTLDDNAAVASLQSERANVLHEIESRALDTLKLRLGRLALESGLNRFRERHRSGMMEHARRAFVALTDGQFEDLRARPDERGRDRLVGVRTDGSVLDTQRMSTGTRLQLFLALRVAAWHEYADKRVPLPFVADDILESFDERRTAAAFRLMGDMSRRGQVVYLTHHRHLIDIAREQVANVRVHELPPRTGAPAPSPPAPAAPSRTTSGRTSAETT